MAHITWKFVVGDGLCEVGCRAVLDTAHQYTVAVVIVSNHEVIVAAAGWVWKLSSLIRIDNMSRFSGGKKACIRAGCVSQLLWKVIKVQVVWMWLVAVPFSASCVFALCIHVAHDRGIKWRGKLFEGCFIQTCERR